LPIALPFSNRLALGAALLACASLWPSPAPAETAAVVPAPSGEAGAADDVRRRAAELDAMLANDPSLRGAHAGVVAVETASGKLLYARNADDEFQPASTLKLVVGSAALERLGSDYRFHTLLEATRSDASGGEAVLLRGGGDPFLARDDLNAAAGAVAAAGGTFGAVYVDDSHFDRVPYAAGWTWDDFAYDYAARASAMTYEENVAHVTVLPGNAVGSPATVRVDPPAEVRTPPNACGVANAGANDVMPLATTGSAGVPSTVDVRLGRNGCLEVFGSIPLGGAAESVDAAVPDPLLYAQSALVGSLKARGVPAGDPTPLAGIVDDEIRRNATGGRVLWQHDSSPLATWLGPRFWIPSDNLVGELLLKELGFVTAGAPGSTGSGIAFETAWLQSIGVDPATITLADGCGMSQYDRITPRDLMLVLQHDWNGPNRQLVLDSLPIGGVRGTIEGIAGTPAAGRVYAKTGSMMHVRGLAGFLATRNHGTVTFAFNVDDWNGDYTSLAALRARVLSRIASD